MAPPLEFVLLSIPYDLKSSLRRGAREGPHALKAALFEEVFNPFSERGVNTRERGILLERGPVAAIDNFLLFEEAVLREVHRIRKGQILATLGGDHSVAIPVLKGLRKVHGKMNILFLDAHPDLYPEYQGDPYSHGCVSSRMMDMGPWRRVFHLGVRCATDRQVARATEHGIETIHAWRFEEAMGLSLAGPTYLSIDLDVLDPAFAPGVGNPVPGGISTRQLFDWIHGLDVDLVGFDICELNPRWDRAGITGITAARILMELMAHCIERRGR